MDNFELKINPNNESLFLPHPEGGYVQFEGMVGNSVRDGKLVMNTPSIYHIDDLPPFAKTKVLEEARRQVAAAGPLGLEVEWLVSESRAVQQLRTLFEAQKIPIIVRFFGE